MRILNVDDNAENLYLIEALFQGSGHQVVSARNGVEALEQVQAGSFEAIISDLLMPRMDGFQLIRELRRLQVLDRTPIVIYTATYTDSKDEALALGLGADRFLIKPAEASDLLHTVQEAIQERAARGGRAPAPAGRDEAVELKEYNSRLIAKLEKKMLDLERANRLLAEDIQRREQAEAERKRLEAQLRQAQKLEAIGTLAGGIAHDFNNILTGILCAAELAQQNIESTETVRSSLQEILKASGRAADLVKQILAFSRQQRIERRPLDMAAAVAEASRFLRATIPTSVELRTELSSSLPSVLADPTQIHQIVTNLCTNAWHALNGRADGWIRIGLQSADVTPEEAALHPELRPMRYVRLSVVDNGCGMDEATRARAFDPFFTTKPPGVGTGLGLSVVHGIIRAYDGAILLDTAPGQGSSFHLYFPVFEKAAEAPAPSAAGRPRGSGQHIFLVDDEEMLITLGQRMLEHLGYTVSSFTDPVEALDALHAHGADLVLVDLSMPKLDGLQFAQNALADRPGQPIILMTGFSATLNVEQIRAQGLRDLLLKPYDVDTLARSVSAALQPG